METKVVQLGGLKFQEFITPQQIAEQVAVMAARINEDYKNVQSLTVVGVLAGAAFFVADLSRQITLPLVVDFVRVSSYANEHSTGKLIINMDVKHKVAGKHILIVEDLIDTGFTLKELKRKFELDGAASVEIAVICKKQSEFQVECKYAGFTIAKDFVIGYGMDFNQHGRNLGGIYRKIE